jgi:hypothetical protein
MHFPKRLIKLQEILMGKGGERIWKEILHQDGNDNGFTIQTWPYQNIWLLIYEIRQITLSTRSCLEIRMQDAVTI